MRNQFKFIVLIAIAACCVFSCKPREKCPAYGQVKSQKAHQLPS